MKSKTILTCVSLALSSCYQGSVSRDKKSKSKTYDVSALLEFVESSGDPEPSESPSEAPSESPSDGSSGGGGSTTGGSSPSPAPKYTKECIAAANSATANCLSTLNNPSSINTIFPPPPEDGSIPKEVSDFVAACAKVGNSVVKSCMDSGGKLPERTCDEQAAESLKYCLAGAGHVPRSTLQELMKLCSEHSASVKTACEKLNATPAPEVPTQSESPASSPSPN